MNVGSPQDGIGGYRFRLALPSSKWRRVAKIGIGSLVLAARPNLQTRFEAGDAPHGRLERAALATLTARYRKAGTLDRLASQHMQFWASEDALPVYARARQRMEKRFYTDHKPFADAFPYCLEVGSFHTLCEIGCGSGEVLEYFAERLTRVQRFVGIDLNAIQMARNIETYRNNSRLEFVADDAAHWISRNARPGMAYFTYGGVFEYFTQPQLEGLFRSMASHPPVCIGLVEPVVEGQDMDGDSTSSAQGYELTNSHPYPNFLEAAGMRVVWRQEVISGVTRWMMLVADK